MSAALRTVTNGQEGGFVKMLSMVLWINLGVWICFLIEICQGSGFVSDTQVSKLWICLNMPETESGITVQTKQHL